MDEPKAGGLALRSLQMIRKIISGIPIGCACYKVILDEKSRIVDCLIVDMNDQFERLSGLSRCTAIGTRVSDALKRQNPSMQEALVPMTREAIFADGHVSVQRVSLLNNDYNATFFFADETLILGVYENIKVKLVRDPLTGLYDRMFATEMLKSLIDKKVRPVSVILGDVNGLKTINRNYGYCAGDEALTQVARVFSGDDCPKGSIGARWSNDEFILLLPHVGNKGARVVMDRMQQSLDRMHQNGGYASVTLGYAVGEESALQPEELIREAERWTIRKKLLISESHHSSIIRLLLSTLYEKSADTKDHSDRMADYCRRVAKKLHLSGGMINDLVLLSMLHDIGKIGVRHEILRKPGPLTPEERREIEQHPQIGYRIVSSIPELSQLAEAILSHHEWWDGSGYPSGLKGEEIPLLSRIIAVVDAYDVIISGRSYRAPRTCEEAIAELKRCAGTQFDPKIVEIFVGLI